MNRNKPLFIVAVLLCVMAFGCISTGFILHYQDSDIDTSKIKTMSASVKQVANLEEEIDPNNAKVVELMARVQGVDNTKKHAYKPEYMDTIYYKTKEDVLVKNMDNDALLKLVWLNLKDSDKKTTITDGFTVSVDDFKLTYEKLFGDSMEFSKSTTSTTADACLKVNYNTKNDNYEFYNTCTAKTSIEIIPVITKAVKADKEFRIYQKIGVISEGRLYKDVDLRNKVADSFKEKDIDKFTSYLDSYVFTFKANKYGDYYFYKVGIE